MKQPNTYHYCSRLTGELQTNLLSPIKSVLKDLVNFRWVNFRWEYKREGF